MHSMTQEANHTEIQTKGMDYGEIYWNQNRKRNSDIITTTVLGHVLGSSSPRRLCRKIWLGYVTGPQLTASVGFVLSFSERNPPNSCLGRCVLRMKWQNEAVGAPWFPASFFTPPTSFLLVSSLSAPCAWIQSFYLTLSVFLEGKGNMVA